MKRNLVFLFVATLLFANSVFAQVPQGGIMAMFPFDGNTTDLSSFEIDATSTDVVASADRFGNQNGALAFNGSTSRVQVNTELFGSLLLPNEFTIAMWVRHDPQSQTPYPVLFSKEFQSICTSGTAYNSYAMFTSIGQSGVNIPMGVVNTQQLCDQGILNPIANGDGAASFMNDVWTHVCYMKSEQNHKVFINGVLVATGNFPMGSGYPLLNSAYQFVNIGGASGVENTWLGDIDDLIVYNRVLNAVELTNLVNADPFGSPSCALVITATTPLCGIQPTEVVVSGSDAQSFDVEYSFSPYSGGQTWYGLTESQSPSFSVNFGDIGTYSISVTDANGCTASYNGETNIPSDLPYADLSVVGACNGGTGAVTFNTSAAFPTIIELSNGQSSGTYVSNFYVENLAAGEYTFELTSTNGCVNTQSFTIESSSSPSIDYNVAGAFAWVNTPAESWYTIQWYGFNGLLSQSETLDLSGLTPGTQYWIVVTDNYSGCTSQSEYYIYAPGEDMCAFNSIGYSVNSTLEAFDICQGSIALGFSGAGPFEVTYTLNGEDFTNTTSSLGYTLNGLCNGDYQFSVVDAMGCEASLSFVSATVADTDSPSWSVYPNPVQEKVFVQGLNGNAILRLYSSEGRLVSEKRSSQTITEIDVLHLAPGLYSLVIETPMGVGISKVLKH